MERNEIDPKVIELVEMFSNVVNNFSFKPEDFAKAMSGHHRTLQQSMYRTMFVALEEVAERDPNRIDGRNQGSKDTAKFMVEAFHNARVKELYGDLPPESIKTKFTPSKHLGYV